MDILKLIVGLLLPWLGAYFWLAAIESRLNPRPAHKLRQLGYAFFLGMAGLSGLLLGQSYFIGHVSYGLPTSIIAFIAVAGGVAFLKSRRLAFQPYNGRPGAFYSLLFCLFVGWAALHLALVTIEILNRPVFPWDAWQTWMYRSKAWLYLGNIVPMDTAQAWEQGKATAIYNTYGAGYPKFVSVIALWPALAMGQWHEQFVNLPTLLCGIALAFAFYGHCREAELPKWTSALGAYLLVSIPLIGSHLALAGQADVWQTGFTGLGFTALLWGIVRGSHWYKGLALVLILLGITVKNEGLVWLLVALTLLAISTRPRLSITLALTAAAIISLAWISGIHYIELPIVGDAGVRSGRIYIPMVGSFRLMEFNLWDDYWANFYESSTWHLLWAMLVVCSLGLLAMPRGPLRLAVASLLLLLLSAQLAIFMFTEQGLWAEDWTAINRLPMHMVPALIFALLLSAREIVGHRDDLNLTKRWWIPCTSALVIASGVAVFYVVQQYPDTTGHSRSFVGGQMRTITGESTIVGKSRIVSQFDNDIAVLSNGVRVKTDQVKILQVDTGGENRSERRFFWRNGPREQDLHSIDIGMGGNKIIHLDVSPYWKGTATEVGFLFYEDEGREIEVHSLELRTRNLRDMIILIWQDWTTMSRWSQKSVHYVPAGAESAPIKLPILMAGWLLMTTLLAILFWRINPAPTLSVVICAVLAWMILDLRWTSNLISQAFATRNYYSTHSNLHLDIAQDRELLEFIQQAEPLLSDKGKDKPVLVVGQTGDFDFEALRMKYHLLPTPAHVRKGAAVENISRIPADNVIIVRSPYLAPGEEPFLAEAVARQVSSRLGRPYRVVLDTEDGVLISAAGH